MQRFYYLIYGLETLDNVTGRLFVGYIRVVETHGMKNVSVVKTTVVKVGNGNWHRNWNVPEIHYQYPLIHTLDGVVHDAIQRAYEQEGPEKYTTEYYPYL